MAARKFLPLFTKGGGGCAGGTDKEGGKSQDNNLFVKIAESGENAVGERSARGGGKGNKNDRLTEGESME